MSGPDCGERWRALCHSADQCAGTGARRRQELGALDQRINGAPVLRLRNRLLPLVMLQQLLHLPGTLKDDSEATIVVTQVGNQTLGILVDRVFDTEEIVVKPVAPILRDMEILSGNTGSG